MCQRKSGGVLKYRFSSSNTLQIANPSLIAVPKDWKPGAGRAGQPFHHRDAHQHQQRQHAHCLERRRQLLIQSNRSAIQMQDETIPRGGAPNLQPCRQPANRSLPRQCECRCPHRGCHAGKAQPCAGAADRRTGQDQCGENAVNQRACGVQQDDGRDVRDHDLRLAVTCLPIPARKDCWPIASSARSGPEKST